MAGEVRFAPTATDYAGARRDSLGRWLRSRRGLVTLAMPPVIFMLVGAADALTGSAPPLPWGIIAYGIGGAGLSVAIVGAWLLRLRLSSRRLYAQSKTVQLEHVYGWSETGFSYASDAGSGLVGWPLLHGWYPGRRAFLLYLNDSLMYFLPLRVLGPAEAADLRTTLERSGVRRL